MHNIGLFFFEDGEELRECARVVFGVYVPTQGRNRNGSYARLFEFALEDAVSPQSNRNLIFIGEVGGKVKDVAARTAPIGLCYDKKQFLFHRKGNPVLY